MPIIIGDSSATGDTSQVDICNLALRRLGATTITTISESTKNAEHCTVFWNFVLDEVSNDYQWNFTKKTVTLDYTVGFGVYSTDDEKTITGITAANPAVVSCASHGFSTGNTVYIEDVVGMTEANSRVYPIAEVAGGNSFQLVGFDSTKWTAYASAGTCYRKESDPKYSSGYTYDLPADCLKALHLSGESTNYEIFGNGVNRRLLTTTKAAILVYNMLEETTDSMLTRFVNAMAWRLAAELAIPLTKKGAKQTWAMQMYDYTLKKMATVDAKSEKQDLDQSDSWLTAGGFTV
jgi:hypothetical protein